MTMTCKRAIIAIVGGLVLVAVSLRINALALFQDIAQKQLMTTNVIAKSQRDYRIGKK